MILGDAGDLLGDAGDGIRIDTELAGPHQNLAGELQQDSFEARARHGGIWSDRWLDEAARTLVSGCGDAKPSPPARGRGRGRECDDRQPLSSISRSEEHASELQSLM